MQKSFQSPSLAQDLGVLADLYRTVIWMMGHKVNYTKEPRVDASFMMLDAASRESRAGVSASQR